MKAKTQKVSELRSEYNFDYSKAVRGKYYKRLSNEGANQLNVSQLTKNNYSKLISSLEPVTSAIFSKVFKVQVQ